MNSEVLATEGLNFIGIGKIMYNNLQYNFHIPHLHFLLLEYEKNVFQAVNLEFQLFALDDTPEKTIASLVKMLTSYIIETCNKKDGFEELKTLALLQNMENYWKKYREIEFDLAREKRDVGHDIEQRVKNIINEAMVELMTEKGKNENNVMLLNSILQHKPDVLFEVA